MSIGGRVAGRTVESSEAAGVMTHAMSGQHPEIRLDSDSSQRMYLLY